MSTGIRTALAALLGVVLTVALAPAAFAAREGGGREGSHGGGKSTEREGKSFEHEGKSFEREGKSVERRGDFQREGESVKRSGDVWREGGAVRRGGSFEGQAKEVFEPRRAERVQTWRGDERFSRDRDRDWRRGGLWWPGYSYWWWPGYTYGSNYYPYGEEYYYSPTPYSAAYPPGESETAVPTEYPSGYASQALSAFREGNYRDATRLATHASIDNPRDPNVHLLLLLGLFATGEYRGAAAEAHAVASMEGIPDWATVFGFYQDVDPYTKHLRALESYVSKNPSAPDARFLLGFQYAIGGHKEAAKTEFLRALALAPRDQLAARLLTQLGGAVPPDIAEQIQKAGKPTERSAAREPSTSAE